MPSRTREFFRNLLKFAHRPKRKRRPDIGATIDAVTFSPHVWEWLDVLGDVVGVTQFEARRQDLLFKPMTDADKLLVNLMRKTIDDFSAIYVLLRLEQVHQAAAHVRLCCEGIITLRYVSQDLATRAAAFRAFSAVEKHRELTTLLEWEADGADPKHVAALRETSIQFQHDYDAVVSRFTKTDGNGKERVFKNWCDLNIAAQAQACGKRTERLYRVVYAHTSRYVHGSPWSHRFSAAYSAKGYDADTVFVELSTVVRATLRVWEEFALFAADQFKWPLARGLQHLKKRLDALDASRPTRDTKD